MTLFFSYLQSKKRSRTESFCDENKENSNEQKKVFGKEVTDNSKPARRSTRLSKREADKAGTEPNRRSIKKEVDKQQLSTSESTSSEVKKETNEADVFEIEAGRRLWDQLFPHQAKIQPNFVGVHYVGFKSSRFHGEGKKAIASKDVKIETLLADDTEKLAVDRIKEDKFDVMED